MSTASLLERYGWHEWMCHSHFSFLYASSSPQALVSRANQLGYRALGICDFDGIYGIVEAFRARNILESQGGRSLPRLHYGAELLLDDNDSLPLMMQQRLGLFAQNLRGYQNLCSLLSQRPHKHHKSFRLDQILQHPCEGIVAILSSRGLINRGLHGKEQAAYLRSCLRDHFGRRFYICVSRLLHPAEQRHIKELSASAASLDVPVLMSQDVFFHHRSQKPLHDLMQAIRLNLPLDQCQAHLFPNAERHMHSLAQLGRLYGDLPFFERSLIDADELSQNFDFDLNQLHYHYPRHMIPDGYDAQGFLEYLLRQAVKKRYGEMIPDKIQRAIDHEIALVAQLGFADYFLTVWDIVCWARRQNILCQGRGSAANSVICFLLGITPVNPDKFELLFERFISVERGDPPDIDVDFEHQRREEVIQYIYQRFGRSHAAMVANVIRFQHKGSLRAAAKALDIPETCIKIVSKQWGRDSLDLDKIRSSLKEFPQLNVPPTRLQLWHHLASKLLGVPRHMGIHSGGFVISQDPLDRICAQEPASMPGRSVIQWSKDDIETLGLFKIDVLALGMLTAIRRCLELIEEHHGHKLSLDNIPQDDPSTYAMIQQADTIGTFQIESRAQMSMLPRLRPQSLYDLVVEVGIVRPGPIQGGFIHPYLKRRSGQEPVTYAHPSLVPILERTKGIPIFQEQIMRMAIAVGDFSPGEADQLRRKMGAWQIKGDLGPMLIKLATGMKRHGIAETYIHQVLQQMRGFAEYGFPESHAAAFALLAYASSYLKCHYPAAFTTALLNAQPMGFYQPYTLIQDARLHGVHVLPVSVHSSQLASTLETHRGQIAIRLGLDMVRGLKRSHAQKMIESRSKNQGWSDLQDFLSRSALDRSDLCYLAAADALRDFGILRRQALWLCAALPLASTLESSDELDHSFEQEDESYRAQLDLQSTGITLGAHPCQIIRSEAWSFPIPEGKALNSHQLSQHQNGYRAYTFGMLTIKQSPPSAKGMVFLTLEDNQGLINLVLKPDVYQRYRRIIAAHAFLCVYGVLQKKEGAESLLVSQVLSPQAMTAEIKDLHGSPKVDSPQKIQGMLFSEEHLPPLKDYSI